MKSEELGSDGGGDDYNGEEDAEDLPLKADNKSGKVYPRGWSNLQFKEPTKCLLCDETFTNRNDINRHVRDTHKVNMLVPLRKLWGRGTNSEF